MTTEPSIHGVLFEDHARLNALLQELVNTVATADEPTIVDTWTDFEQSLLTHFDAEERYLLPVLDRRDPSEGDEIRAEHRRIRHLVAELGVRADLHVLRKETVDQLAESLRAHAAREDRMVYQLADEELDEDARRAALEWLERERAERRALSRGRSPEARP